MKPSRKTRAKTLAFAAVIADKAKKDNFHGVKAEASFIRELWKQGLLLKRDWKAYINDVKENFTPEEYKEIIDFTIQAKKEIDSLAPDIFPQVKKEEYDDVGDDGDDEDEEY